MSTPPTTKPVGICYSLDNENFNMTQMGDVIDELTCLPETSCLGATYWRAEAHPISHKDALDVDYFLENCDDQVHEEIGEIYNNDFSNCGSEAKQELETLLVAWAEKHVKLSYWKVRNAKEMTITESDLA